MKYFGYIYITTNTINGKRYIGQHISDTFDKNYKGSGIKLKEDFVIYGKCNFSVKLIEWCDSQQKLNDRERYWINYYDAVNNDNFYNISYGGQDKGFTGLFHTEQSKRQMSETRKKNMTDEYKKQRSLIKYATNERKGKAFWVNNGVKEHLLTESEFNDLLKQDNSFVKGRIPDRIYVNKDGNSIIINKEDLDKYLIDGYSVGKDINICNNICKSRQMGYWIYNNIKFNTAKELVIYLNSHGYPNIVKSTVVNIGNGKIVKSYKELTNKITRIPIVTVSR